MHAKSLFNKLNSVIRENGVCKLNISYNVSETIGYILNYNEKFVLLWSVYDFKFNGYKILAMKNISDIKYDDTYRYISSISKKEGITPYKNELTDLNILSYKNIFGEFCSKKEYIAIECIGESYDFKLGLVTGVYDEYIEMKLIDGIGEYFDEVTLIYYNKIISILFRNKYIKYMSKYAHRNGD